MLVEMNINCKTNQTIPHHPQFCLFNLNNAIVSVSILLDILFISYKFVKGVLAMSHFSLHGLPFDKQAIL